MARKGKCIMFSELNKKETTIDSIVRILEDKERWILIT